MARRRLKIGEKFKESLTVQVDVRFSEVDALHMVWHGHYIQYLEAAREAFGKKFNLGFQHFLDAKIVAPIIETQLFYHSPGRLGDQLEVEINLIIQPAAKLEFYYEIRRPLTKQLLVEARTVQAFTTASGEMILTMPKLLKALYDKAGVAL